MERLNTVEELNNMRLDKNPDKLKYNFHQLLKLDRKKALNLINDDKLDFCTLFLLKEKIYEFNQINNLNIRNKIALSIISELQTGAGNSIFIDELSLKYVQMVHSTLSWIIYTGAKDDGFDNEYDDILDKAVLFLVKTYRDNSILPIIADMIFKRHVRNLNIHDLVWAFFEGRSIDSLILIGNRLKSSEEKEAELANKLLMFIPEINLRNRINPEEQYQKFIEWINENSPFLFFKGESFQQTNNPIPYEIIWEAKYLRKRVHLESGKIIEPLSSHESNLIGEFKKLDQRSRILLSNYSHILRQSKPNYWNDWLHSPISEQVRLASGGPL